METIVITIRNKEKGKILRSLLKDLPFVEVKEPLKKKAKQKSKDFFLAKGIWKDAAVTLTDIRKKAWQKKS
jgi:ribosomal protein L5